MKQFEDFNRAAAIQHGEAVERKPISLGKRAQIAEMKWHRQRKRAEKKRAPNKKRGRWSRAEREAARMAAARALDVKNAERRWGAY